MLKAVATVREAIIKEQPSGCADLQAITRIVSGVTLVDHVWFTEVQVKKTNPILGSFRRFERRLAQYEPQKTVVEIRYANHLSAVERKFVVCKELCHALDVENGVHHVTDAAIEKLVETFSLRSQNLTGQITDVFSAELLAEVCAVEIICPISIRKCILEEVGGDVTKVDYAEVSERFGLPSNYARMAFLPDYMKWIEERFASLQAK